MSKIQAIKVYRTEDGSEFNTREDAERHQLSYELTGKATVNWDSSGYHEHQGAIRAAIHNLLREGIITVNHTEPADD